MATVRVLPDQTTLDDRADSTLSSLLKALELLCSFSTERPEWGVTELAAYLGLSKSTAHRILTTCEQFRFVERTESRRYRLGSRALELGNIYRFDRRLLLGAEPALRRLAEATQSTTHLAELDGREIFELMRCSSPKSILFTPVPVLRAAAHATATGKVLLANCDPPTLNRILGRQVRLKRYTPATICDPDELKQQLAEVAQQGYAISDQEATLGCCCIAVPLRNRLGRVVAAVSISNTSATFATPHLPKYLGRLFQTAEAIGRDF